MHEPISLFAKLAGYMTRGAALVLGLVPSGLCVAGIAMLKLAPDEPPALRVVWIVFCVVFAGTAGMMALALFSFGIFAPRMIRRGADMVVRANRGFEGQIANGLAPSADTPPDWAQHAHQVTCVHCARVYAVTDSACPGCGSAARA